MVVFLPLFQELGGRVTKPKNCWATFVQFAGLSCKRYNKAAAAPTVTDVANTCLARFTETFEELGNFDSMRLEI